MQVPAPGLEPGLTQSQSLVGCQLPYAGPLWPAGTIYVRGFHHDTGPSSWSMAWLCALLVLWYGGQLNVGQALLGTSQEPWNLRGIT
jgi:hypothetical protein